MDIEFKAPSFLNGQSRSEILARMLDMLPDGLDKSEGQFPWQLLVPTATEKAEMAEFIMPLAIQSIFPMWSEGIFLDYHAQSRGIKRKPAVYATGKLTVGGTPNTEIPAGFKFMTAADYGKESVTFIVDEDITLGESPMDIKITAEDPGIVGNVAANSIVLMSSPMTGITEINNDLPTSGGIDEETDESLRQRILDYDRSQGVNFVGSVSDYKRWAEEVQNVGYAKVISAQDESGKVTIIVSDAQGNPATAQLCIDVYNHIMRPDAPELRLPPPNASIRVIPPSTVTVFISATIEISTETTIEAVKQEFFEKLKGYYKESTDEIRYTRVGALLSGCKGVIDYDKTTLALNGFMENIVLQEEETARSEIDNISLTEAST